MEGGCEYPDFTQITAVTPGGLKPPPSGLHPPLQNLKMIDHSFVCNGGVTHASPSSPTIPGARLRKPTSRHEFLKHKTPEMGPYFLAGQLLKATKQASPIA